MSDDLTHFETIANRTVASLPEDFRPAALEVILRVVDWPPADLLDDLGIADPRALTGLYQGIPVTHKSVLDTGMLPDVVWIFRQPILLEWRERGNVSLDELITHVVIHEFAHHFGWTDDEIAAIDQWWK